MSDDKELVADLRMYADDGYPYLSIAAADRIEALTKERDEADDLAKAAFADGASNNIRLAETSYRVKWLEAKLAQAVEALEAFKEFDDLPTAAKRPDLFEIKVRKPILRSLAEIKGDKP